MPHLPLTATPSSTAPMPLPDQPVVGPTEVVAITVILGGIALACIAALLIKALGGKALDKVKASDVPVVLKILATWINPFTGFLPSSGSRYKVDSGQATPVSEGSHRGHPRLERTSDERLNK